MTGLVDVPGIISAASSRATIDAIAVHQLADGNLPWIPGGHTDPWNMVEALMALDLGGHVEGARAGYEWLRNKQHADGSWHAYYIGDEVEDPTLDTNVTCYVATGAWHHYLTTGDTTYLGELWPMVEAAIDYALDFQRETGEIAWRGDDPDDGALLTGSSSIHLSLQCAIAIAEHLGHERPDWELSLGALAIAIAHRPDVFLDKQRWAMDWYYPILGGVLRGYAANARIATGWSTFAVESRGLRCVSDRPWITAAETCEMVMALDAIGAHEQARVLFGSVQFLARRERRLLDRITLRGCRVRRPPASCTRKNSPRGTRPRSCWPPTRSSAPARRPACSAANASRRASPPTSSSPPASRSNATAPPATAPADRFTPNRRQQTSLYAG